MAKWEDYLEGPLTYKVRRKRNKTVFCKKNVVAPRTFGPHIYEGSNICKLCGHLLKQKQKLHFKRVG